MSSRVQRRASAREARLSREEAGRTASRRRRIRVLAGGFAAGLAAIVLAAALSAGGKAGAAFGGRIAGAASSSSLLEGIPQRGTELGRSDAPVRLVEFADLQCPFCREYTVTALPTLVRDYVRTGKVQMQFENLSFIGPDSVTAGHAAAAAASQDKLWNFIDLMYLNQGTENTGYATAAYLRQLLGSVPGLNVPEALSASQTPAAEGALTSATELARGDGITGTPSFLIGRSGGPLHRLEPATLTAAPFAAAIETLIGARR